MLMPWAAAADEVADAALDDDGNDLEWLELALPMFVGRTVGTGRATPPRDVLAVELTQEPVVAVDVVPLLRELRRSKLPDDVVAAGGCDDDADEPPALDVPDPPPPRCSRLAPPPLPFAKRAPRFSTL